MICWLACACALFAQTGTWRAYMSYYEPQQIVKGDHYLFVRASNGLYSYNLNDHAITTYDKMTGLSEVTVSLIGWNTQAHRLIVVYDNQQIDLLTASGSIVNINALANKSMTQDKTVNRIVQQDEYAYLSCNFGIVKVNMQRAEISESYMLNQAITATAFANSNIYARKSDGTVLTARQTDNLLDASVWKTTTAVPAGLFDSSTADWDEYLETVKTLQPGGPRYNNFGYMKLHDGHLYTVGHDVESGANTVMQIMQNDDEQWTVYDEDIKAVSGQQRMNAIFQFAIDPNDKNHVFMATSFGLMEYENGKLKTLWNQDNSPIETALPKYDADTQRRYNLVTSVSYDREGTLFLLNSNAATQSLLSLDPATQTLKSHPIKEVMIYTGSGITNRSIPWMKCATLDSRGWIWFVNDYHQFPSVHYFYTDEGGTIRSKSVFELVTQDGNILQPTGGVQAVCEDRNHDVWIGTSVGPLLLEKSQMTADAPVFTQVKVPRNDGSNYADYLLNNIDITCIAIDAANRKWFGTSSNGVYVISDDNMEQVYHFDQNNSRLLSNTIRFIDIDDHSGCVYIATDRGLCSYVSDATTAYDDAPDNQIYAYPNPVTSDYTGLISIVGFSFDSDVKVVTASGKVVAQGRSNGGTFTWDGCDRQGRRVASGVYMVVSAKSDGSKGVVCKVAVLN